MKNPSSQTLLGSGDPSPVQTVNPSGASPFLLIGDHAGNRVPAGLEPFGVDPIDMLRHIAWDIGIAGLGAALAGEIDAVFIHQTYSRLVIDCNRDPTAVDAMPPISDGTVVPPNQERTPALGEQRVTAIHTPYQAAIAGELARRDAAGADTVLVALHSFTPSMRGFDRPWQIGILHSGGDASFAHAMLRLLEEDGRFCVGNNEPYAMDGIDYTVPRHAFAARRPYVEIEIRQDLLADATGQAAWARTLARLLPEAATLSARP